MSTRIHIPGPGEGPITQREVTWRRKRAKPVYEAVPGSELAVGNVVAVDAALWTVLGVEHGWIFGTVDLRCVWHGKGSRHRLGDRTEHLRFRLMGWMRLSNPNEGQN